MNLNLVHCEPLLTPAEVADHLQVPLSTLAYWRKSGAGPRTIHVGRRLRYTRADLQEWIDRCGD